jgi:hypothetical protein
MFHVFGQKDRRHEQSVDALFDFEEGSEIASLRTCPSTTEPML